MNVQSNILRNLTFRSAAILAGVIWLGHLALALFVSEEWQRALISDVTNPLVGLLAVAALAYAARRSAVHSRRLPIAWGVLALAHLGWVLGDVIWGVLEIALLQPPFPSLADVFYLTYYPLFVLGVLYLPAPRLAWGELLRMLLGMGIVMLSALIVFWNFLIGPMAASHAAEPLTLAFSIAYPVFDLALLWSLLALIRLGTRRRGPWLLLACTAAAQILTDSLFAYQSLEGTYVSGGLLDLGWVGALLLAALAGVWQAVTVQPPADTETPRPPATWALYVPYAWLIAAYCLLIWSHDHTLPMGFPGVVLGVGLIIGLALIQQMVALVENARLHRRLRQELDQRERTDAALRESEARYRAVVEDQTELICRWRADGALTFVNDAYCRYFGKTREELLGHTAIPLIHAEDRPLVAAQMAALSPANPVTTYEHRVITPAGEIRWQQWTDRLICDEQGRPLEFQSVGRDITTRKHSEDRLRAQNQLLEQLVAIAHAAAERPTLEATLQNVLETVTTLASAEYGDLILVDPAGNVTHSIVTYGQVSPEARAEIVARVMERGLAGWVARQRQAALVADTTQDERWLFVPEVPYVIRSALSVPILSGATLLGVLTLVHAQPNHFDDTHLHLMQAAMDQIALGLRNAQMFEVQRRMADQQTTLYEILRAVSQQLDPDAVTRLAVEAIVKFTGWPNVSIALPTEDGTHWEIRAASGRIAPALGMKRSMNQGVTGRVFRTAQTQLVPDVRADSDYVMGHPDIRSELAVPLLRGKRVVGELDLGSDRLAAFDSSDVLLAESLAEALALALENARLYQETDRLRVFNENIVQSMEEGIFIEDEKGHATFINPKTAELLGYTPAELLGKHWSFIVAPEQIPLVEEQTTQRPRGVAGRYEVLLLTSAGQRVPVIVSARPLFDGRRFAGVLSVFTDITERKRAEEALRKSEERWRTYVEQANDLIFGLDAAGRITMVNHAACRALGYASEELVGKSLLEFIAPESRTDAAAALSRILEGAGIEQFEIEVLTKMEQRIIVEVRGRTLFEQGQLVGTLYIARDVTERRQAEERLRYLSSHDALTGLYNRAFFEETLLRLERSRQFPISVLMADVDGLKATNDRQGHAAGDDLLRRAARVLRAAFRAEDVIARIGGDEFAVLLPDADAATGAAALARLVNCVTLHNSNYQHAPLSFSLGIATGEKGHPLTEVLKEADQRMYRDKFAKNGRTADE